MVTLRNMSFCSTLWIFPGLISPLSVYSKNFPLTLTSRVVNGLSCEQPKGLSWPLVEGVPYLKITPTMSPGRELKMHEDDLLLLYPTFEFQVTSRVQCMTLTSLCASSIFCSELLLSVVCRGREALSIKLPMNL